GCTARWMGLVGLAMYLPMAALRELPLNAAALTGLAAYLFAFVAQNGGLGNWAWGAAVAVGAITAVSTLAGLGSLAVTGLYFTVVSLVVQVGIEKTIFPIGELTGGAGGRGVAQPDLHGWFGTNRAVYLIAGVTCLVVSGVVWYVKQTRLVSLWGLAGHPPGGADGFTVIPNLLESHRINPNLLSGGILLLALVAARAQVAVAARLRRHSTTWEIQQVMGYARPALEPPEVSVVDCPSMALVGEG